MLSSSDLAICGFRGMHTLSDVSLHGPYLLCSTTFDLGTSHSFRNVTGNTYMWHMWGQRVRGAEGLLPPAGANSGIHLLSGIQQLC